MVLRRPVCLSICSYPTADILNSIENNKSLMLTDFADCCEVLRFTQLKNDEIPKETFDLIPNDNISTDKSFLYKLKIRLVFLHAQIGNCRKSNRAADGRLLLSEYSLIKQTILAIRFYNQLEIFTKIPVNALTHFQKLAAKCMRTYLLHFLRNNFLEKFENICNKLQKVFIAIAEKLTFLDDTVPELCAYCNDFVQKDQFVCKEQHEISRCCITMIQVCIKMNNKIQIIIFWLNFVSASNN